MTETKTSWLTKAGKTDVSDELRKAQAEEDYHELPELAGEKYLNLHHYEAIGDDVSQD